MKVCNNGESSMEDRSQYFSSFHHRVCVTASSFYYATSQQPQTAEMDSYDWSQTKLYSQNQAVSPVRLRCYLLLSLKHYVSMCVSVGGMCMSAGTCRAWRYQIPLAEATQHGCLLWDIILTRQKCVTFANAAEYYFV